MQFNSIYIFFQCLQGELARLDRKQRTCGKMNEQKYDEVLDLQMI